MPYSKRSHWQVITMASLTTGQARHLSHFLIVDILILTISRPQERVGGAIGQNAIKLVQQ